MVDLQQHLAGILNRDYGLTDADPDTALETLGLDSFSRVEFGALLQDTLGVEVAGSDITSSTTLGELVQLLTDRGAKVP